MQKKIFSRNFLRILLEQEKYSDKIIYDCLMTAKIDIVLGQPII